MSYVAAGSAALSIVGGIIGGGKARRAKRRAAKRLKKMNAKMAQLEANRQEIGVAADIESQEKSNEDKRAAGEQRLQDAKISEAQRMQNLDAAGKQFVYSETENREMMALNRLQGQIDNQQGIKAQASRDQTSAITGAIGGVASALGSIPGK